MPRPRRPRVQPRLAVHRERLGLTQQQVADRIIELARQFDNMPLAATGNTVARHERGRHRPGDAYLRQYRRLYQATDVELGFAAPVAPTAYVDLVRDRMPAAGDEAVDRREMLRLGVGLAVPPDVPAASQSEDSLIGALANALAVQRIDQATRARLEQTAHDLDTHYARYAADDMSRQLDQLLTAVISHLHRPQAVTERRKLCVVAGRLVGLRAWCRFDLADHPAAKSGFRVALSAVHEAEDWGLAGWLVGARSLIPYQQGDYRVMHQAIQAATSLADRGADPTVRAWLYALNARASAAIGDVAGFTASYRKAETLAPKASVSDRRHSIDFADNALSLDYYAGTGWLLLNRFAEADRALRIARAALPATHRKANAVLTLHLGEVAARRGDLDSAAALAVDALIATRRQPIMPIMHRARTVRALVSSLGPTHLDEFDEHLAHYHIAPPMPSNPT